MSTRNERVNWPRRGTHWDVFNVAGELEIESCDDLTEDDPIVQRYSGWNDDDANGFVLMTASRPPEECPRSVVEECCAAVREIVKSWEGSR